MKKKIIIESTDATVKDTKRNIYKDKLKLLRDKNIIKWIIYMIGYSFVLIIVSNIFSSFKIKNELYAFLAAIIINILNRTIKPLLKFLTLPITILSFGIFYELSNVIILYITSFILGKENFMISGLIIPLFISLIISTLNVLVEGLILKPITERK